MREFVIAAALVALSGSANLPRAEQQLPDRRLQQQAVECFRAVRISPEFTRLRSKAPTLFGEPVYDLHLSDGSKASPEEARLLGDFRDRNRPCRDLSTKARATVPGMADDFRRHHQRMDEIYTALATGVLTWGEANARFVRQATQQLRDDERHIPTIPRGRTPDYYTSGNGTGFFVTEDGYIVTNAHVVRERRLYSALHRGRLMMLRVIDVDEENDLALTKIEARGTPIPLALALPAKGEDVAALGYPAAETLGRELKATFGRINARSGLRGNPRTLQTDAPVQPGNSGGPLVNMRGEVVGVVSATFSTAANVRIIGGAIPQNVNYAVKAEYLVPLLDKNIRGKWRRGSGARFGSMAELVRQREPSVVLIVVR